MPRAHATKTRSAPVRRSPQRASPRHLAELEAEPGDALEWVDESVDDDADDADMRSLWDAAHSEEGFDRYN